MMSAIFALWASVLLGMGGPVTGVSIVPAAERTQVLIAVDGEVEYRHFTMEGPNRLVVDLFGARHQLPQDNYMGIRRGGVVSVRTSQYSSDVVRVVLELDEQVPYDVVPEEGALRIWLDTSPAPFEAWSTGGTAAGFTDVGQASFAEPAPAAPVIPAPATEQPRTPPTQVAQDNQARRITIDFTDTSIQDLLSQFSDFSGRSIVTGSNVSATVSGRIDNQPWDAALNAILAANGMKAIEEQSGIIVVHNTSNLSELEGNEPRTTQAYKVNYATATEIQTALQGITTENGQVTVDNGTNTIIINDIARVHREAQQLISQLDVRTPQVQIKAKIIFVNRTDLNEFGVTYDLKDSAGNQLNVVSPGATDADGDGTIELPEEEVAIGTNVFTLGGNSVAALGNATSRVAGPTLTLLSSLLVGRHTLLTFVEALESLQLSEIQAEPQVTVADNNTASIQVGEDTPLRVVDASAGGAGGGGGGLPTATTETVSTGIILTATPHVTDSNNILLELEAERSAPVLAASDAGFIFQKQLANTRVLVRDGQTVVIAGLTVSEDAESRSGIPLLMELPFIGRLFRVTRESHIQRDLIILVTPYIVRDN